MLALVFVSSTAAGEPHLLKILWKCIDVVVICDFWVGFNQTQIIPAWLLLNQLAKGSP